MVLRTEGFWVPRIPDRRRSYIADYHTTSGKRRRMVLGPHGLLTTEQARDKALVALASALNGGDPAGERTARRKAVTVSELCRDYLDAAERNLVLGKSNRPKKPSTLATDRGRIARHIVPLLGNKPAAELTAVDIQRFVRDVSAGKTAAIEKTGKLRGKAVVEGGYGTATRTTGLLGGILSYAVTEGIIANNPARGVRRPSDGRRQRRLAPAEYAALGASLAAAERDAVPWQAIAGTRLLALTGCRLSEIAGLLWTEVDLEGSALRLEDTKEGASARPIGGAVLECLFALPRSADAIFVLPAARKAEGCFGGLGKAVRKLCSNADLSDVTAHTLRHSFGSVAGDLEYSDSTIGAMMGHAGATITSRYVHRLDATLLAAAEKVSQEIVTFMTGYS